MTFTREISTISGSVLQHEPQRLIKNKIQGIFLQRKRQWREKTNRLDDGLNTCSGCVHFCGVWSCMWTWDGNCMRVWTGETYCEHRTEVKQGLSHTLQRLWGSAGQLVFNSIKVSIAGENYYKCDLFPQIKNNIHAPVVYCVGLCLCKDPNSIKVIIT